MIHLFLSVRCKGFLPILEGFSQIERSFFLTEYVCNLFAIKVSPFFSKSYLGKVSSDKGKVSGKLNVKQWNTSVASVFGSLSQFEIELSGSQGADRSFQAGGNIVGQPSLTINLAGRFLSELA